MSDGATDSELQYNLNDISSVESKIMHLKWEITVLATNKRDAKSITEFYNYGKLIRVKKEEITYALRRYKELEIENDLPINLEYRSALKKLEKL